jgi:hypothetical protein
MKFIRKNIDFCFNMIIFVPEFQSQGREQARLIFMRAFLFASILIFGLVPPCGALMRPLPLWWNSTGKTGPFLFTPVQNKNFLQMNSTEKFCQENNNLSSKEIRPDLVQSDEIPTMRRHLREMIDAFLLNDETADSDLRRDVYSTFLSLDGYLKNVDDFNLRRN